MKFGNVEFHKSVSLGSKSVFFDEKPEIVFLGRSNVGKSSIMNTLFGKKDLVKTSARPGKTQLANLFLVSNRFYFTDLPGYGFAKLGKAFKEELEGLISWYVEEKKDNLKKVIILIDSRLGAQQIDIDMYKYILELELPITIVLSKTDKMSKNELSKTIAHTKEAFFGQEILPVSSLKKLGIRELEKSITQCLTD